MSKHSKQRQQTCRHVKHVASHKHVKKITDRHIAGHMSKQRDTRQSITNRRKNMSSYNCQVASWLKKSSRFSSCRNSAPVAVLSCGDDGMNCICNNTCLKSRHNACLLKLGACMHKRKHTVDAHNVTKWGRHCSLVVLKQIRFTNILCVTNILRSNLVLFTRLFSCKHTM